MKIVQGSLMISSQRLIATKHKTMVVILMLHIAQVWNSGKWLSKITAWVFKQMWEMRKSIQNKRPFLID